MERRTFTTVAGLALLLSLLGAGTALSHTETDNKSKSGPNWTVRGVYVDTHPLAHTMPQAGRALVYAYVKSAPQHKVGTGYTLKVQASLITRLSGLVRAKAAINRPPGGGAAQGYRKSAIAGKVWSASPIDAKGLWFLAFGNSNNGGVTHVGHKRGKTVTEVIGVMPPDDLATTMDTNGVPEFDADGDIVLDQNGDIVWDTPPILLVRLTSTVTESGGSYTYTYKLENLASEDLDFVIPEVTTSSFPSGWSGNVSASSYEEISITETDAPYSQHATVSVTDTEGTLSSERATTGEVYVPKGRLVFGGTNTISDSYYDSVLQANVVEFSASEDVALALLLRVESIGDEEVDEVESLTSGLTYALEDYSFLPSEDNDYRVRTGSGVNGWEQAGFVTISN